MRSSLRLLLPGTFLFVLVMALAMAG